MNIQKKLCFFPFILLLIPFFSCVAEIGGVVREGGAAELTLNTSLGPRTTALIRSLRAFAGEGANTPILDGLTISRTLALAPGVRAVSLRNTSPEALGGNISISNIEDFLTVPNAESRFITFSENRQASSIVITLDRVSAPQLISLLSPEISDYLSALMAPVVLGEIMTPHEYLDLVASIYSRPLANEIAEARIRAIIDFPRPVTAIRGGTFSGNKAEFYIPLLDILVLERPLRYEVSW
jgi:hypothetical protein